MAPQDIRDIVPDTIRSVAPETDVGRIPPDRPLRQAVELDSMDWLNVIAGMEERLSLEIPPSDHARLLTLDWIVDYVAPGRPAVPRSLVRRHRSRRRCRARSMSFAARRC
jgi:acyl carrier protein